jgi:hypothetical protein
MKYFSEESLRKELQKDNLLPLLLDDWRKGNTQSQHELEMMWLGLSDFCYHLAKKHYGEPQKVHCFGVEVYEHTVRMDIVLQFIQESNKDMPINGVIFSIHRRYAWIELLVEMKVLGVEYLEEMTVTKKVNSIVTKEIINALKIERMLEERNGRKSTEQEVIVEYTRQLLNQGKSVSYVGIERFFKRYHSYKEAKNRTSCVSFDETFFLQGESDSDIGETV